MCIRKKIREFVKKNVVMVVALIAAAITMCIVLPDRAYLDYFDFKTLTCLFSVLAVVSALKNIHFFYVLARKTVEIFHTARSAIIAIVCITFLGSMLIANDMALLTFLPLGYFVLHRTNKEKYMAFTFIMQNIAANLGGMLTPFGNPQNLFLYTKFSIPNGEFLQIMAPPFFFSVFLIILSCFLFVKPEPLILQGERMTLPPLRSAIYMVLFFLAIVIVFRIIPYYIGGAIILITLCFLDRKALKEVDYPLLLTFVFFFIFAGNMGRMEGIRNFFSALLNKNTFLVSTLSCQFISNVPSAILLSQFTENYPSLLLGVNIGGIGTIIASLASLITLREYGKHNPGKTKKYLLEFSAFNFGFLILLILFVLFLPRLIP